MIVRRWAKWGASAFGARLPLIAPMLILAVALQLRYYDADGGNGLLERVRNFAFDTFQAMKPREFVADSLPVRIVDIDEAALEAHGQWPWPRDKLADLVNKLVEQGVAVIAFDMVFAEPDRSSIRSRMRDLYAYLEPEAVQRLASQIQDTDLQFADAVAHSKTVLGFGLDYAGRSAVPAQKHRVQDIKRSEFSATTNDYLTTEWPASIKNLELLEAAAQGNGSINTDFSSAVIRAVPMFFRIKGAEFPYPSLSLEALRVAFDQQGYRVKLAGGGGEDSLGKDTGIVAIAMGPKDSDLPPIQTTAKGQVLLYDTGHKPERYLSAKLVMDESAPKEKLEGHIVFIGTSAIGLKDLRNTPLEQAIPGVSVHVQMVEQMLTGTYLERPDYAKGAETLYLVLIGILLLVLMPRLKPGAMALVTLLLTVGVGMIGPWIAFSQLRMLIDPIYPAATLALMYVSATAFRFMKTEAERAAVRSAFGLYLSPELVEDLARNPANLRLGGEQRELTVMFTDIRGFTTISEKLDPPGLTRFLNRFLTPMTDIILGQRGTVDKYMGDAIMAFWNAPLAIDGHAARACEAAMAMQKRLAELNRQWKEEAERDGEVHVPASIGIGLNSGVASVGNFGSEQRFSYSVIGDAVNLASRLEGQCKTYRVGIIVGERTREQAGDGFAFIELDSIRVKGKTQPERIYALAGDAALLADETFIALVKEHTKLLALYRKGAFAEAAMQVVECQVALAASPLRTGYYEMMTDRILALIDDSPPDWDGVFTAKDK
jgi:adenylate cyclase